MYKRPWAFLLGAIAVLFMVGYGITELGAYGNEQLAWSPQNRPGVKDYMLREKYFDSDSRLFLVLITDPAGDDVISKANFEQIIQLKTDIEAFTYKDKTYSDYCRQVIPGTCQFDETDPLNYWYDMSNSMLTFDASDDADVLATINSGVNKTDSSWELAPGSIFSSNTPAELAQTGSTWDLQKSPATSLKLFLENTGDTEAIDEWEVMLYKELINKQYAGLEVNFVAPSIYSDAFSSSIQNDLVMVQVAIMLIVLYSFFVVGYFTKYQSRFMLTFGALFSILISLFESYAISSWLGFRTAGLHNLLPFLILGIGFDDVYVMMNGLDHGVKENPEDVEQQIVYAYEHNAMSITISSLTNLVSFSSGYFSQLDSISSFGIFAGFGIFFLFFNTLNLFGPMMVYDAQRQADKRVDCCGVLCCCLPEEKSEVTRLQDFYTCYYDSVLSKPLVKAGALVLFIALMVGAVFGVANVEVYFNTELFVQKDNPAYRSITVARQYYQANGIDVTYYMYGETDYSTLANQAKFGEFKTEFEASTYYNDSYSSWYDSLVAYVDAGSCDDSGTVALDSNGYVPQANFIACVNSLIAADPSLNRFITMNANADAILNATLSVTFDNIIDKRVAIMDSSRRLAKFAPQPTFAFYEEFLDWDTDAIFITEVYSVLGGNIACIFVILLLTFGSFFATVIVTGNVICTVAIVTGSIYYWGLELNTVSIVHLFMSVGVSVDYSAHIMHEYLACKGTHDERSKASLTRMAPAVTHAILSTFLAIIVTGPSTGYIFMGFFRLWLGIVVFGTMFAVFFMPILLSLVGPAEETHEEGKGEEVKYNMDSKPLDQESEVKKMKNSDSDSYNDKHNKNEVIIDASGTNTNNKVSTQNSELNSN